MPGEVHDPVHQTHMTFGPRGGDEQVVETWMDPGAKLPPHYHPKQTEYWYAIDGTAEFRVGKEKRIVSPEDGEVEVPPNTVHGVTAVEDRTVHLGCRVVPPLGLQDFLEESAQAAQKGYFFKGGIPRTLAGARWGAKFLKRTRGETVMVSPPPPVQSLFIRLFARS